MRVGVVDGVPESGRVHHSQTQLHASLFNLDLQKIRVGSQIGVAETVSFINPLYVKDRFRATF